MAAFWDMLPGSRSRAMAVGCICACILWFWGQSGSSFPSGWRCLQQALCANSPLQAALSPCAVAAVNAGVYALVRLIYYTFGTEFLSGSWAQYVVMSAALVTIVYGSSMALRTPHLKRRLAYSTVSNLPIWYLV